MVTLGYLAESHDINMTYIDYAEIRHIGTSYMQFKTNFSVAIRHTERARFGLKEYMPSVSLRIQ